MGRLSASKFWRTYGACLLMGGLISSAHADPVVISNLSLLDELTRESVTEIAEEITIDPSVPVTIFSSSPHEGNELVKRYLGAALAQRGHSVTVVIGAGEKPAAEPAAGEPARPGGGPSRQGPIGGQPNPQPAATSGAATDTTGAANDGESPVAEGAPDGSPAEADPGVAAEADSTEAPAQAARAEDTPGTAHFDSPLAAIDVTNGMPLPEGRYPDGVSVDVRVREFGVRYAEVSRRLLIGPVQFTRIGGVYLEAAVLHGSHGNLSQTATAQRHHWDRISGRTRALCEGVSYPYAAPELKAPPVSRYVEPAVVTGIVGSLIYLFYTNQN